LSVPATLISLDEVKEFKKALRTEQSTIAFVPTLGALHHGHLALVRRAKQLADRVVVSIFVNPTQFGPNEDFAKYPRTVREDIDLLATLNVDAVFLPNTATIYPAGFETYITNRKMSTVLCGASRSGHFDGVLTVVMKLINIIGPDIAVFGKKDYQQLKLIEQMFRDFNHGVRIEPVDTVREPDGLALSSRNRFLSDTDRELAVRLNIGLRAASAAYQRGEKKIDVLIEEFRKVANVSGIALEYAEIRRQSDLESFEGVVDQPPVLLIAAKIGQTRLIDNLELDKTIG
jgi:pantoate--beta-alanine ligase